MSPAAATPRTAPPQRERRGPLAGTPQLIRLVLRRDRVWLPIWILLTLGLATGRAASVDSVYPDTAARHARYQDVMSDVPMFKLFQGPAYDDSAAALIVQETFGGATLVAALGAAVLLVRHTRGEEAAGRRELVGAAAVGRHAPLAAALAVVLAGGAVIGALTTFGLLAADLPAAGSVAFGLVAAGAVAIAAGLAAVAAQLAQTSPAAGTAAFAAFIGMHFLRGVFDLAGPGLSWAGWLVPNGWLHRTRPYADERWWPFLLVAALVVVLVAVAATLSSRRDTGAALGAAPASRPDAPRSLHGVLGLAWRLHRPSVAAWAAGTVAIALPSGFAGAEAMGAYADTPRMREWAAAMGGGATPGEAFFAYIAFTMGFPITMYAIMTLLRLDREEHSGHAELLLSAPVDRIRWAVSHLLVALAAPAMLQLLLGLCFGLASGQLGGMLATTLSLVPAIWVMVGITMAACGLLRRGAAVVGWGALIVALSAEFGQHLGWPEWLFLVLSPFAHVLPFHGRPGVLTLSALALLAAVLCATGLAALRRRDLLA